MIRLPTTPKEAQAAQIFVYFTGKPCPNGHLSPRFYRGDHNCLACRPNSKRTHWLLNEYIPSLEVKSVP